MIDSEEKFLHFEIDTDGYPPRFVGTKEEAQKLLFDDIFKTVRENRGRILWRVLPSVEQKNDFDWRAFARFSIEVGIDGDGVLAKQDWEGIQMLRSGDMKYD